MKVRLAHDNVALCRLRVFVLLLEVESRQLLAREMNLLLPYELVPGTCSKEKLLMLIKYICTGDTCINEYYLTIEQHLFISLIL